MERLQMEEQLDAYLPRQGQHKHGVRAIRIAAVWVGRAN